MKSILLKTLAACLMCLPIYGTPDDHRQYVHLQGTDLRYEIQCSNLNVNIIDSRGNKTTVSEGINIHENRVVSHSDTQLTLRLKEPNLAVQFQVLGNDLRVTLTSKVRQSVDWPCYEVPHDSDFIWLFGDGRCIPMKDESWVRYIDDNHRVSDSPFWGHLIGNTTLSWICQTPYRNELKIEGKQHRFTITQTFLARREQETHIFQFSVKNSADVIYPAKAYRAFLKESGQFISADEKFSDLPTGTSQKLLGAIHAYLWGAQPVSNLDIKKGKWQQLAKKLFEDETWVENSPSQLSEESRQALQETSQTQWVNSYQKHQFREAIKEILETHSPEDLYTLCPEAFTAPPESWGQGISPQMIRELKELGIQRARLIIDNDDPSKNLKNTAIASVEAGYLMGIYDSYDSIHPESIANTDESWMTAQLGQTLFENASIQMESGAHYKGFQGRGRMLNPVAAHEVVQERVSSFLAQLPLNAYFMDCEGVTSEVHEDYNPSFESTSEDIVAARKKRLRWLRENKQLVVGTEGTDPSVLQEVLFAEWGFSPPFFWEDPDFKDKKSKYFNGHFWPADAPQINFKTIPLKKEFLHRYFDPSNRIPLLQAVLHDSVIITHHWNSDMFKYEDTQDTLQLMQMLYLSPPLYNLNRKRLSEEKDFIQRNYQFFSPLHAQHGFDDLVSFQWLSTDRLLQKSVFSGGLTVIANFSTHDRIVHDQKIPARSVVSVLPEGNTVSFSPSQDD